MKKCPYCAEEIQDDAILCRYCGSSLEQLIDSQEGKKKCPYCAEWIKQDANVCRYCENTLDGEVLAALKHEEDEKPSRISAYKKGLAGGAALAAITTFAWFYNYSQDITAYHPSFVLRYIPVRFITNLFVWTIIFTVVIFAYRRNWREAGIALSLGAGGYLIIIFIGGSVLR